MKVIEHERIGRVHVGTISLPAKVKLQCGTYTYSGKVLISYKTESNISTEDFYNLAVIDDDGTNFKVIFSGVIPTIPKANGIRYMPFQDNKRVLLGDYVLECTPDIDSCEHASLIPVEYPSIINEDENTTHRWSEIIIAPDNEHMCWTMLRSDIGAAVGIGTLTRHKDAYLVENVQLISTISYFETDQQHPGYLLPNPLRGGEVKQFIHGGNAISVVGGGVNSTPDSVVQDLVSERLTPITYTPGYDETTIFSPDECLGLVMSTRFSKYTDPAIFGLVPRPYGTYTSMGIAWSLYTYAITGVRDFREGNIGPVLIEIDRSMNEPGYRGIQLTTNDNWVYVSPMSWHPDGKRAIWLEMLRGSKGSEMRIQQVQLPDYKSQPPVPFVTTPDDIPYGIRDLSVLKTMDPNVNGKIKGKHSGYIDYTRSAVGYSGNTEALYVNFSDDGVNYYNGYERTISNIFGENRYESDLKLTGSTPGEMKFRATFSAVIGPKPLKLLFDVDVDGMPKSYGYASYNGITLNIADLLE